MATIVAQFAELLDSLFTEVSLGTHGNLFFETLPERPYAVMAIFPYYSTTEFPTPRDEHRIQLRIRAADKDDRQTPYELAYKIWEGTNGWKPQHVSGYEGDILLIMGHAPATIGFDEQNRAEFVINYVIWGRHITAHRSDSVADLKPDAPG